MTVKPPEGPKARYPAEKASEGYIPKPPSKGETDRISEQQGLITDEWTGEPPAAGKPGKRGA
ncbi:hypothetical protein E0493_06120 [Roseomonas sp. M0104]|uniref:Uncharacterized protein n=1 Tax=Teichococcus coralli TaxID=2545983 RepID=A0A845BC43_9PROT|nr:hypothetical protein [Pseudoroseomonas coralli]MXP62927.1 hypothetical protein [Pseudoroseomonas coralli]